MKSFTAFLYESEFLRNAFGYHHQANVKGLKVNVRFEYHPDTWTKGELSHYNVAFQVEDQEDARHHQEPEVLRHVRKVVHHFINWKKPEKLTLTAGDDNFETQVKKKDLYQKFTEQLAKKYNAKAHHDNFDTTLEFPK